MQILDELLRQTKGRLESFSKEEQYLWLRNRVTVSFKMQLFERYLDMLDNRIGLHEDKSFAAGQREGQLIILSEIIEMLERQEVIDER